jgi:hypothetical protein
LRSTASALLRRLPTEHVSDEARQMPANQVIKHLELSGFEIDWVRRS